MNAQFVFKGYDSNLEKGQILFHYQIRGDKNIDFTEKIFFPPVVSASSIPPELLKSFLDNLMLILGISYWKTYCPREIVIENNFLTKDQAEFWNTIYTKGLGEFFYKNKIDFRGLVNFPFDESVKIKSISFPRKNRSLLAVGGGKDSIVAGEMIISSNKDFGIITSSFPLQIEVAKVIGGEIVNTKREIDPKLLELNKQKGVYNGHIPISVYYAFISLMAAVFYDYNSVVVGNEKSANYGNVEYLGQMINHQWSKSEEFEKLFNEYVKNFITPDITYSSPLRDMSELEVVQEFVNYPKYFKVFSSCNTNFRISPSTSLKTSSRWCGKCPKCLFVFICLAAYLSKEKLLDIFGKNLLEDESLIPLFEELIGVKNFKPFECVGTPEEVKLAFKKVSEKGEFKDNILTKHFKSL